MPDTQPLPADGEECFVWRACDHDAGPTLGVYIRGMWRAWKPLANGHRIGLAIEAPDLPETRVVHWVRVADARSATRWREALERIREHPTNPEYVVDLCDKALEQTP